MHDRHQRQKQVADPTPPAAIFQAGFRPLMLKTSGTSFPSWLR
jgi:hypothetical protein